MSRIDYFLIAIKKHKFKVKLSALIRYQSLSYFDQLDATYPTAKNYPISLVDFVNKTPQKTVAFGDDSQLYYNYIIKNEIIIGCLAGFQVDPNGDNITNLSLTIGKRLGFKKTSANNTLATFRAQHLGITFKSLSAVARAVDFILVFGIKLYFNFTIKQKYWNRTK